MDVWARALGTCISDARALGILGVNLCPGIRSWEVNFAQAFGNF